jgi:hypothetical protein
MPIIRTLLFLLLAIALARTVNAQEAPAKAVAPKADLTLPGETFAVDGCEAFLIPAQQTKGEGPTPWVWYAPTLKGLPGSSERMMFERFTAAGIAIAGIDVGESYGSPEGRTKYTALYETLVNKRGMSKKPVLLGRSRGGLMLLCWACENSDKVGGFAGIYPVCDLSSYPGIAKAAPAYQLTTEGLQTRLAEHNPPDRLAALARARVPLFAIHGDMDSVVPLEKNSGQIADRYAALSGKMELIVARGEGHNMWPGFFESPELMAFVIRAARGEQ